MKYFNSPKIHLQTETQGITKNDLLTLRLGAPQIDDCLCSPHLSVGCLLLMYRESWILSVENFQKQKSLYKK